MFPFNRFSLKKIFEKKKKKYCLESTARAGDEKTHTERKANRAGKMKESTENERARARAHGFVFL